MKITKEQVVQDSDPRLELIKKYYPDEKEYQECLKHYNLNDPYLWDTGEEEFPQSVSKKDLKRWIDNLDIMDRLIEEIELYESWYGKKLSNSEWKEIKKLIQKYPNLTDDEFASLVIYIVDNVDMGSGPALNLVDNTLENLTKFLEAFEISETEDSLTLDIDDEVGVIMDEDPRLELAKKIFNKQHPDNKTKSLTKVYRLSDPFVYFNDFKFGSFSKEDNIIWLIENDIIFPEDFGLKNKEELKEYLESKSDKEYLVLINKMSKDFGGPQRLYEFNDISGLEKMLNEIEGWDEDLELNDESLI